MWALYRENASGQSSEVYKADAEQTNDAITTATQPAGQEEFNLKSQVSQIGI